MLKLLGSILVLLGSAGYAFSCKQELQDRLYQTRCMETILELLESEIRYSKASLPEACKNSASRVEEPYRRGLLEVFQGMEKDRGIPFSLVWKQVMEKCLQQTKVNKKDRLLFLQFAEHTGYADYQMQQKMLQQCRQTLGQSVKKQEESMENKAKVVMSMGVIGGLFLTIVLL